MRLFPFSMWKCSWVNNHFGPSGCVWFGREVIDKREYEKIEKSEK